MLIHVLLYEIGEGDEGIHSIEINGNTIVLMFEDKDDADRYCGLLEAQDFPRPTIQIIDKEEIEQFCKSSGYETRFVQKGFIPKSEEERLLLTPPQRNLDVSSWDEKNMNELESSNQISDDIESYRRKLEDLI